MIMHLIFNKLHWKSCNFMILLAWLSFVLFSSRWGNSFSGRQLLFYRTLHARCGNLYSLNNQRKSVPFKIVVQCIHVSCLEPLGFIVDTVSVMAAQGVFHYEILIYTNESLSCLTSPATELSHLMIRKLLIIKTDRLEETPTFDLHIFLMCNI